MSFFLGGTIEKCSKASGVPLALSFIHFKGEKHCDICATGQASTRAVATKDSKATGYNRKKLKKTANPC